MKDGHSASTCDGAVHWLLKG